ncbi:MAG: hypothetical protein QM635_04995 [Microbacteriaceae bacterium]
MTSRSSAAPPGGAAHPAARSAAPIATRLASAGGFLLHRGWWLGVLLVFLASRLVTTAIVLWFAAHQADNPWNTGAQPSYADFARIWDGNWYWIVADSGYPSVLPRDDDGLVSENAWAFLPAFPFVVRTIMVLAGTGSFAVPAIVVSVLCAAGAALVLHRMLRPRLSAGTTMFAVLLFCVAPLSPILQLTYAEPMFLLLIGVALLLLQRRRYLTLLPFLVLADLTRPGGLAFALALAIHVIVRFARRHVDPFERAQRWRAVAATVVAGLAGLAWPAIAAIVTGDPSAYTDTELAWRSSYIGDVELLPFTPWVQGAIWWFRWVGWPAWLAVVLLALTVAAAGLALFTPPLRRLGTDVRAWLASYALYLLAVFFPQSSTFRVLMPLFPALGALAIPRSRVYRVLLVLACVVGQAVWMKWCWWYDGWDWTPP